MKRKWILTGLTLSGLGFFALAENKEPVPPAFEQAAGTPEKQKETDQNADPFDPDVNAPHVIQVQVEYVEMAHESLTKLLFLAAPKSSDATALRKQVQDMVVKNEAKVLETQIVVALSGQKATTESIHEFIYPTEYTPVTLPNAAPEPKEAVKSTNPRPTFSPTVFESKNLGSTLEVEPTIESNDGFIHLRLAPELVWHTGETIWHEGKDSLGNTCKVQLPDFYILRMNTSITCIKGKYTFVTALSPKDANGNADMTRKVLVFAKCDILTVK